MMPISKSHHEEVATRRDSNNTPYRGDNLVFPSFYKIRESRKLTYPTYSRIRDNFVPQHPPDRA